ncbi:MAG: hypothetical protein AMXMBFR64_55490 [Myxococcales bacterium]
MGRVAGGLAGDCGVQEREQGAADSPAKSGEWSNVSLNLVYTYPVQWSRFKVLRDFVQNFFDAIGPEKWASTFSWRADGTDLVLEAAGIGFTHEWLHHIGAPTKTAAPEGTFAGFFGEGFKIAALCAHMDHGWAITMASHNWELEVGSTSLSIDGQSVRALCYRVRTLPATGTTRLVIGRTAIRDARTLQNVSFRQACVTLRRAPS